MITHRIAAVLSALAVAFLCGERGAQAAEIDGTFTASAACAATKKKDSDNPGNVHLERRHGYTVTERNGTPGTHYRVLVPGAPVTELRWVPMDCGSYQPAGGGSAISDVSTSPLPRDGIEYVLVANWQAAFCASEEGRNKKECRTATPRRFDATHFSLHGLWPDDLDDKAIFPCYCDRGQPVSCDQSQSDDRRIDISPSVLDKLAVVMPGVQSHLERHEWPKHGSCYEDDKSGPDRDADPDEYFTEAMAIMAQLNASGVRALFADNIGRTLTRSQIEAAFDDAFGKGASERVTIRCSGRDVSELWINLAGDITPSSDLSELILAAPPTSVSSDAQSCARGRVVEMR